uniref:Uncharacterized protein n=1 Tax=Arundo donax TaxID=35708 RepID=A0A0A9C541_ARUDO
MIRVSTISVYTLSIKMFANKYLSRFSISLVCRPSI